MCKKYSLNMIALSEKVGSSKEAEPEVTHVQVQEALPEFEFFPRRTEPDAYGASYLIALSLGKKWVPRSFASWKHGWPHAEIIHPVQIAQHGGPKRTHLVPRREHVELLHDFGYSDVHAVGMPFVYADSRFVERIPDSLLVMPPHTLPYTDESWNEKEYVEAVADLKSSFSTIIACIHRHNIKKGQWTEAFDRRGIEWIPGTRVRDKHGLIRMHTLFSMFEYMTTNTIGSHVPYAAYCGCKVSIYGPFSAPRKEDYQNDPMWSKHPDVLEAYLKSASEERVREKYPFFFVTPDRAEQYAGWAQKELGNSYRRPSEEIASLLGWSLHDQLDGYANLLTEWDLWTSKETYRRIIHRVRKRVRNNIL